MLPITDHILLSLAVGFFAGLIGSLVGIGGGVFITPFLTLYLGIPIRESIAATIVSVIATSTASGSSYLDQKITHVKLALFLEISTVAGAVMGALLTIRLSQWLLFLIFGSIVLYMAYNSIKTVHLDESLIARGTFESGKEDRFAQSLQLEGDYYDISEKRNVKYSVRGAGKGSAASFLAGVAAGLLGIGGGIVKVAVMNLAMNVPIKVAVATSRFMIGITAASGALVFLWAGLVNPYLVAPVAMGTTLGATLGTSLMNRVRGRNIKILFFLLMLYLGYAMLANGLSTGLGIQLPILGGSSA